MLEIRKALQKSIQKAGLGRQMDAFGVIEAFKKAAQEVLPPELCQEIEPISFKNGALKVRSTHPAWAMQLKSHEKELLAKLDEMLEKSAVDRLILVS